jgi:hypothetical protein
MIAHTHSYAMRTLHWKKGELASTLGVADFLWPNKIKAKSFSMHLTPKINGGIDISED